MGQTSVGSASLWQDITVINPPPKGGWGCLMSPPYLESQGCHLILHFAISSLVLLPSPVTLSVLSFSACWPFLLNFFQKILQYFSLRDRLFCMAPIYQLGEVSWPVVCAACYHMLLCIYIILENFLLLLSIPFFILF